MFKLRIIANVHNVGPVWKQSVFDAFDPASQHNRFQFASEHIGKRPSFCQQFEADVKRFAFIEFTKDEKIIHGI
jgi:hypothetical protein